MNQVKQRVFSFIFFAIVGVFFAKTAYSQNRERIGVQPKIGDKIPNFVFNYLLNKKAGSTSFSKLQGKLIVLDFGNVGCTPCVNELPAFDSLQLQFKDKVQIFWTMDWAPSSILDDFLATNKIGKSLYNLGIIPLDTTIVNYFKPFYIPHLVWINEQGVIIAVTEPEYLNDEGIRMALSGKRLPWPLKRRIVYNIDQDLIIYNKENYGQIGTPDIVYHSVLTSHIGNEWDPSMNVTIDSLKQISTIHMKDYPIYKLYSMGVSAIDKELAPASRYIIKIKDSTRIFYDPKISPYRATWNEKSTYCYELSYPSHVSQRLLSQKIISDLNMYLGLNGRIIDTVVNCWVIKPGMTKIKDSTTEYKRNTLNVVADYFNIFLNIPPVFVDKSIGNIVLTEVEKRGATTFDESVYRSFPYKAPGNAKSVLLKFCKSKGLVLAIEKRKLKMFVLTDQ